MDEDLGELEDREAWNGRWLRSVRLERFKAAFQPDRIALHPFTAIIGRNGSGKSTLLEALQWIDTTMRQDSRAACHRYHGIHDLVNLRSQTQPLFFEIEVEWGDPGDDDETYGWHYGVRVEEQGKSKVPTIAAEHLYYGHPSKTGKKYWIATSRSDRRVFAKPAINARGSAIRFDDPLRLAMSRGWRLTRTRKHNPLRAFADFWSRAVFLRLSPNRLAEVSSASRSYFEPLLDEEGHGLPALLSELDDDQRQSLVASIQRVMSDIVGVSVKSEGPRDENAFYSLSEKMPYRGRAGKSRFPIPSWMLSEGTRRLTAIFALLEHSPPPSLLCIEEIENGLDPWTVRQVMARLRSAVDDGTQVVVTTHSPWVLDDIPLKEILHVRRSEGETVYEQFADEEEVRSFGANVPPGTRYVQSRRR